MDVVVAVVSWNTRELLRRCLDALRADVDAGTAEVWVVDNASTDGSAAMVAADYPWVRLIAHAENVGFGAAVNDVAGRVSSAWIAPANADTAVRPGALGALLAAGHADPGAGIIAPRLILPDNSTQHSAHPFPRLRSALAFNIGLARLFPRLADRLTLDGGWDPSAARTVDWAHGAFLLIRRSAFDLAGGFDTHQFLYAEDLDIAWRIARAGFHTRYEPAAEVEHAHGAAITQLYGDERDRKAQASAYAWMLRRRGPLRMRSTALINTLGAGARAVTATLHALASPADANAGLRAWTLRRQTQMHLAGLLSSRRSLERHR